MAISRHHPGIRRHLAVSMEEWLKYAPPESLSQFMYQKPTQAKRLFFDVIPKNVDDYLSHLSKYPEQDQKAQLANPAWHIHNGHPPVEDAHLSYNILLNLAGVCNSEDKDVLWHFISRYRALIFNEAISSFTPKIIIHLLQSYLHLIILRRFPISSPSLVKIMNSLARV